MSESGAEDAGSENAAQVPPLTVTVLKVGKADAIILQEDAHVMVIDTGEDDDGQEVTEFLTEQGISRIDVLLITHYDKDHVGGADTLLEFVRPDRILLPDYDGSGTEYRDFLAAMDACGVEPERLTGTCSFSLGSCQVQVDAPLSYDTAGRSGEIDNDFSLITTVIHGQNRLLFTGDAEKLRIREWLDQGGAEPCTLLKVPHHGVYEPALADLLDAIHPAYAVICDSNKNPADTRTLEMLENCGADVLETRFGDIRITSDGTSLELRQKGR